MPAKLNENTEVALPLRNIISMVAAASLATWAYFGIVETLNKHSTKLELMEKDLAANSEFRIKYPRGELGQSSGEAELFMLVEHMAGLIEGMEEELKNMRNNKVNIDFLKEQVSKLQIDVEKLIRSGNG
tara:strand:- start:178 stop:564 length:387 start_codon:yes stop_codon:yes gene_type:complete